MIFKINGDETIKFENLSKKLGDYLTGSKITRYLAVCGLTDTLGSNATKYKRIFNAFANEINSNKNDLKIVKFIEIVCDPSNYNSSSDFNSVVNDLNTILLLMGCKINQSGKIISVETATTLDEALERTNKLKNELEKRNIHFGVMKYCSKEYLNEDYFHACFEAVKGVYDRIRSLTGLTDDGNDLLNKVFKNDKPLIIINSHSTESEINDFIGLKSLLLFLNKSVRNTSAHNTRLNNEIEFDRALDIFVCVSLANKYLDNAQVTCFAKT